MGIMRHLIRGFSAFLLLIILSSAVIAADLNKRQIQYLSGTGSDHTIAWDFYCTGGRQSGYWTTIQVPSCWEQQGFGTYNYGRDYVTYGRKFRFADEKGLYRHEFNVPSDWKNKQIYLVFEGSMTDTEVLINGESAGDIHQGAFYRFRYNITGKLQFDQPNKLEVNVSKMSADHAVNRAERYADYWIFGGIFRPVYLEAYPEEFVERVAINARANGSFTMDAYCHGIKKGLELDAQILDDVNNVVATCKSTVTQGDVKATLKCKVDNPSLWTSESPNLYKVNVQLLDQKEVRYETTQKFGFRTIEIRPGEGIFINGTQVKMKGVNRHCFWPETGRTLNRQISLKDALLIKEMNMNAVRCSHYPPDQDFLDICDSLGIYVLDELAGWQNAYDTRVGEKLVKEMVVRDVNHPSIIFWDNGNEGGTNKELDDDFGLYDPSGRPVIHPHHRPGNAFNFIDTNHYENYYSTQKILEDSLIYMPTEFLHSQSDGGGGAALGDFWELMWHSKRSGGGFIWAMLDEGIVRTDLGGMIDVNRINAPDGILGPHREKEGSIYAIKEIYSPVYIVLDSLGKDFSGDIPMENRYFFTNLHQCSFKWALVNFHLPFNDIPGYDVQEEKTIDGPALKPGEQGTLHLQLPANWRAYDALLLTAMDPHGRELYTWNWKIRNNVDINNQIISFAGDKPVEVTETDSSFTMKANGITVSWNKNNGQIMELKNDFSKSLSFGGGPLFCNGKTSVTSFSHHESNDGHTLEVKYDGGLDYARWTMYKSGWLELDYTYTLDGNYNFTGISFNYPEGYVLGAKWLGGGPVRVWKNRMQCATVNVWEKAYNDTQTGSYPWFYPEFKGYYPNVSWLELNTAEGKFLVVAGEKNLFVRLFDFYGLPGPDPYPKLPPGDISLLDNIPPIGSMLAFNTDKNPEDLGPASHMNEVHGTIKRTVYFYFGFPENATQDGMSKK